MTWYYSLWLRLDSLLHRLLDLLGERMVRDNFNRIEEDG